MKNTLILVISLLSASAHADWQKVATELMMVDECSYTDLDHTQAHQYLVGDDPTDTRVAVTLTLASFNGSESNYSEVELGIIPSLERRGDQIVHARTGAVCAEKKGGGIFGGHYWKARRACQFSMAEEVTKVWDQNRFRKKKVCTRSYNLEIYSKIK